MTIKINSKNSRAVLLCLFSIILCIDATNIFMTILWVIQIVMWGMIAFAEIYGTDENSKTLIECKDEVARKYGYDNWVHLVERLKNSISLEPEKFIKYEDEAMELYGQQFSK